jgi:ribosomal protein S18 acetylase RimI-like enzyme
MHEAEWIQAHLRETARGIYVAVPGLEIVPATRDVRAFLTVGQRAFGAGDEPEATDAGGEDWRARRPGSGSSLLGLLDGEPVAVAPATPPRDGLSEVAGIGVLEHARRRGIGGAMTAAAARPAETSLYYADPE